MHHVKRVSVSILVAVTMLVTAFAVMASAGASAAPTAMPEEAAPVLDETALAEIPVVADLPPDEKIDAALKERMNDARGDLVVEVLVTDRAAVNEQLAAMGLPEIRGIEFQGMPTPRAMDLSVKQIWALAENPGVYKIMLQPELTYEPGVDKAALEADGIEVSPEPIFEDFYVDIAHGAVDAWSKGYTGSGINIAVIDTGFDMAHPDLQGQQARYPSGPYMGWPIAYDDLAAAYWSYGTAGGWVSDTSYSSIPDIDGLVEFDGSYYYVLDLKDVMGGPITSASGWYRIGYHPDQNLMSLFGSYAAVLVVDSTTPFVYDTVYVDIMHDYSFSDDKACTKGDEISYFDFYDADLDTYDFTSWDAGDGYADLSGGMVYWISDGTNTLPGSDLWWGWWAPASGDAVAFMGEFYLGQSHGTMTSSAALASGATLGGLVAGMAPSAKLITIPMTNDYFGSWIFATLGADGTPGTDDDAHIVSNSYGFSDSAIVGGFSLYDAVAWYISSWNPYTLWCWSTGNGGPGYGTVHSVTDHSSVHVGAGTTMQYRGILGYEPYGNQKWGDVIPFSNSGPGRNGKLNAEIIASGAYSLEPAPLNQYDLFGGIGDGSMHIQVGSGTSHACPTVAGGAALGYEAYYIMSGGSLPMKEEAKAWLLASSDDMHNDVFKQGAGWLNASRYVEFMGNWMEETGTVDFSGPAYWMKGASYPGSVYGTNYETFPNLMYPGESYTVSPLQTINFDYWDPVDVNISAKIPLLTASETLHMVTEDDQDVLVDIAGLIPASTDLVRVTMFMPFSQFDPDMDYVSDLSYWLEAHDWVDTNADGMVNITGGEWELFRFTVDGSDSNYNQITVKDPIERISDGLIVRARAIMGAAGVDMTLQIDCYELQTFPWITFYEWGAPDWTTGIDATIDAWGGMVFDYRVDVPTDAPVGSYGAGIYIEDGKRVQCLPVVINVAADSYEFEFGGASYFETLYNNSFTGVADKGWRFEVGDWRIFWSMPLDSIPSTASQLITSVEWTELPTDVNVHMLASFDYGDWQYESPYGPGYGLEAVAGSDEDYLGAGTFGVSTNTGGPKEVVAAEFGFLYLLYGAAPYPSPFAVVTRCPVMAGTTAYDNLHGETAWVDLNAYDPGWIDLYAPIPGPVPLEDDIPAWYDITVTEDVEVKGGGTELMTYTELSWLEIYQDFMVGDFNFDLANAEFTYYLELADCSMLTVETYEIMDAPDIDLGLWYDENMNGMADLDEPFWVSGTTGSYEYISLEDLEDGLYIIKVLGYSVIGSPGYFGLGLYIDEPGAYSVAATGMESPVGTGTHDFVISYSAPAVSGYYLGYASFGFMGADDLVTIPFTILVEDDAPPAIENLYPADGEVIGTSSVEVSFWVNDRAVCFSGFDIWSPQVLIDNWLWMMTSVDDENVTATVPFALVEGEHTLEIWAADILGNWVYEMTTFVVDSVMETFTAQLVHPDSGVPIPSGSTVALDEVTVDGWADPYSEIDITTPHTTFMLTADDTGYFSQAGIPLDEGYNVLHVVATNLGGVSEETSLMLISDMTCELWVDEPPAATADPDLVLEGLTEEGATVTVNGMGASVAPDGGWSADVVLSEGMNELLVEAEDALGNTASETVYVSLDTTPPSLVIISPDDGTVVAEPTVLVEGTTDAGATVLVNGVLASDGTDSWSALVALSEGNNTVTVVAEDDLGNQASESITVEYVPPVYVTPEEMQEIVDDLQDQLDDLVTENADLQTAIDDLQGLLDDLEAQLGDADEALLQQLMDLQEMIDALEDEVQQDVNDVNTRVDDTDSFASMLMYMSVGLFAVAIILLLVVWMLLSRKMGGKREEPAPPPEE